MVSALPTEARPRRRISASAHTSPGPGRADRASRTRRRAPDRPRSRHPRRSRCRTRRRRDGSGRYCCRRGRSRSPRPAPASPGRTGLPSRSAVSCVAADCASARISATRGPPQSGDVAVGMPAAGVGGLHGRIGAAPSQDDLGELAVARRRVGQLDRGDRRREQPLDRDPQPRHAIAPNQTSGTSGGRARFVNQPRSAHLCCNATWLRIEFRHSLGPGEIPGGSSGRQSAGQCI